MSSSGPHPSGCPSPVTPTRPPRPSPGKSRAEQGLDGWTEVIGGIYRGLPDAAVLPLSPVELVTGRMPAQEEADELDLDLGSPVLDIRRTTDRGGPAVVHMHIVVPADRVSLAYRQLL